MKRTRPDVPSPTTPLAAEPVSQDLIDTTGKTRRFATLHGALRSAGLTKILRGKGPFTLFAPTDKAFAKLPADEREKLFTDRVALADLLRYHVVRKRVKPPRVGVPRVAKTLQGQNVELTKTDGQYRINRARILKSGFVSNGVIHAINTVLVPRQGLPST